MLLAFVVQQKSDCKVTELIEEQITGACKKQIANSF
jgi:hypothetical protein